MNYNNNNQAINNKSNVIQLITKNNSINNHKTFWD